MGVPESLFDASDSQLAMELAARLSPVKEVLARYGLSNEQFKEKSASPTFRKMYQQSKAFWQSDANTKQRILVKSQMLLEDSLLILYQMIHDPDSSNSVKLDAAGQLATLADAKPRREADGSGDGGSGFHLTLNLTGRPLSVECEALGKEVGGEIVVDKKEVVPVASE
jgi:hypothetical protein